MKENNIELVLHGHSHEIRSYNRKGIQFLNAGASVDNFSKDSFAYLINIILDNITFQRISLTNVNKINSTMQLNISNELEILK
jgi:predicted phosphodiesterase